MVINAYVGNGAKSQQCSLWQKSFFDSIPSVLQYASFAPRRRIALSAVHASKRLAVLVNNHTDSASAIQPAFEAAAQTEQHKGAA